jgi:UDP-N-acetylglucosamine:LPS N-acetylglucosamine transferase
MRTFGVPTLFIPNTDTGMDDQVKRCQQAEKEGWGLVVLNPDKACLLEKELKHYFASIRPQ